MKAAIDDLIAGLLRGEAHEWPWPGNVTQVQDFCARADYHGMHAILCGKLSAPSWPPQLLALIRNRALTRAMWELSHQHLLRRTLESLQLEGVEPVLIKGTALAYSTYSNPALRPRGDTDFVIPEDAEAQVHRVLTKLGFAKAIGVSGEFASYQATYSLISSDGFTHDLDVHWRITNSEVLSRFLTYLELRGKARHLQRLGGEALHPSRVHALVVACVHRCTHNQNPYYVDGNAHLGGNRLIWIYDIHLLAGEMGAQDWDEFADLVVRKQLRAVCLEGLEVATGRLGTMVPDRVLRLLHAHGGNELAARYVASSKMQQQWLDFRALPGSRARLKFLAETCFPSRAYMMAKYPAAKAGLPWLYGRRVLEGVLKRYSPQHQRYER
jgi:hypothetical protein